MPSAPLNLKAEVLIKDEHFCAGKAPAQDVLLTAHCDFGDFSFPVHYFCPKSDQPVPCVILLSFSEKLAKNTCLLRKSQIWAML